MEKYLTYEDESSKKFWRVQTDDKEVTVNFGRIGTAGQTQTREYASAAAAEKEAAKQADAKIKKGYKESAPPAEGTAPTPAKAAATKTPAEGTAPAPAKAETAKAPPEAKAATPAKAPAAKAAPAKKAPPKTEAGPAPVAEDGQPRPWHDSGNWDYSWYCGDEAAFTNLDKPLDSPPDDEDVPAKQQRRELKTAAQKTALSVPEGVIFDEDDDDSDREEKILLFLPTAEAIARLRITRRAIYMHPERLTDEDVENSVRSYIEGKLDGDCQWSRNHEKCLKWIDILRALTPDEGQYKALIASCLAQGMKDALRTYGSVDKDDIAHIQWLLENGAPIVKPLPAGNKKNDDDDDDDFEDEDAPRPGEYETKCEYIRHFVDEYKKAPDPARVPAIFAAYREDFYKKHAADYAKGLVRLLTYLATGEDLDSGSPGSIKTEECPERIIHFDLDMERIMSRADTWQKSYVFGFDNGGIHEREGSVELQKHLTPLLRQMAAEGVFDKIKSGLLARGLPVLHITCNLGKDTPFLHLVLDEACAKAQTEALETLIAGLESCAGQGAFANVLEETLKTAATALVDETYLPRDIPRFRRLMDTYTYNLHNAELAEAAHQLTGTYDKLDFALQRDWSAHALLNYGDQWKRENLEKSLSQWDDLPAMKARMTAFAEEKKARDERNGGGGKRAKKISRDAASFAEHFTEADIFLNTENVIARAYKDGSVYIRFKIEGEAAYAETLDWLNALLEKKYAGLNSGYSIFARFLIEPVFIKQLENATNEDEGYGFPKTSCHAFFARAVQYPALREKVKRYAENALNKYDWYTDLDGEENTVTGTFAALALAFCEEQYIPLAGLYGRESDDEHQYIQLMVTKPLFRRWGAAPAVACALFDIAASNGQQGGIYLPQAVLQSTACLKAIVEHGETGPWAGDNFLKYCVPRFVEGVWSEDVKKNLKRLAIMRNEAADAADKNTIAEFYNFYKKYAAELNGEDYGKDMHFEGESPADIVIPGYHEEPPLLLSRKDARAAGWEWNDGWYGDKRGILVHPASVDSLDLYGYIKDQWDLACKNHKNLVMGRFWGEGCCRVGEYVFNTRGMKYSCAIVLTDGKNKPFVLYGLLNAVPLVTRWCKRPFKTAEEAYAARAAALIKEAPEKPAFSAADLALEKRLDVAINALFDDQFWIAGQIAKEFTPEQGRFYDAALVARIQIAKKAKDDALARELTEELAGRKAR